MGIVQGLSNIKKHQDELDAKRQAREENKGVKADWFSLKDGQAAKVRPLQELDQGSPHYSEKNGLGFLAVEHNNPARDKWMRKALCSHDDEGACWACEQHEQDFRAGWKQKTRLYVNVLVDNGTDEPFVAILSQGNGPKSVTPTIIEYATETGSITNRWFKIKRQGSQLQDTSYTVMALDPDDKVKTEDYELFDLNKVVRTVPYDEQERHYTADFNREPAAVAAASASNEW